MAALRGILRHAEVAIAPGVYDAVSARLVERAGFGCLYMTGSGVSMSGIGYPDIGVVSLTESVERLRVIARSTSLPVIADADDGYGGPLNVYRTVQEFERAGAAAVQIEDQVAPKKCGHELGRRCIPIPAMQAKISAALAARSTDETLIVARTDARTSLGLDAAIERAEAYAEAGADVLFLESLETEDEMRTARKQLHGHLLMANMVEGGRTPLLTADELQDVGFNVAIFPNTFLRLLCGVMSQYLERIRQSGNTRELLDEMWMHNELWELFDHSSWVELEQRIEQGIGPTR